MPVKLQAGAIKGRLLKLTELENKQVLWIRWTKIFSLGHTVKFAHSQAIHTVTNFKRFSLRVNSP